MRHRGMNLLCPASALTNLFATPCVRNLLATEISPFSTFNKVDRGSVPTHQGEQFINRVLFVMRGTPTDHSPQKSIQVPLRLMALGGSITYGVGSSDGNGYRKILRDMLVSDGHKVSLVGSRKAGSMDNNDNEGWRGFRIDQICDKAQRPAAMFQPNIFTVNAGSNDCIQGIGFDQAGKCMGDMLETLWLACPSSTIVLSTLLVALDIEVNSRVLRMNDLIRCLAETKAADHKRIVFADMQGSRGPQVHDLTDDGIHPNDAGYKKMAEIWFDSIQEAKVKGFL